MKYVWGTLGYLPEKKVQLAALECLFFAPAMEKTV